MLTVKINNERLDIIRNLITSNPDITARDIRKALLPLNHNVTIQQVYRDLKTIHTKSSFVSDLAKKSYSDFVESRINRMIKCANVLEQILDESDDTRTRMQAARILHMCEGDLVKIVSTDVLKVSAANWAKYVKDLEAQIVRLTK